MTNDHFTSLDAMLADAKASWAAEKKALEDRIFALETELALIKGLHEKAIQARSSAEAIGVKLLTQFATVAHVFEEARSYALQVGVDLDKDAHEAISRAREAIEAAVHHGEGTQTSPPNPPTAGGPESIVADSSHS